MNKKWNTKEVVIITMICAVLGVLYALLNYVYLPIKVSLGTVFVELTFGIYLLSAALPMYIVRKPGAAIFGALVTAGVSLFVSCLLSVVMPILIEGERETAFLGVLATAAAHLRLAGLDGIQFIIAGALQAIGVEFGYILFGPYEGNMKNMTIGHILGTLFVLGIDIVLTGFPAYRPYDFFGVVAVRLFSAVIIGILLVKIITAVLVKAGVLKGFACVRTHSAITE